MNIEHGLLKISAPYCFFIRLKRGGLHINGLEEIYRPILKHYSFYQPRLC